MGNDKRNEKLEKYWYTRERERERELYSRKIGFICDAKNNMNKIDYKTEIKKLRFISAL